MKTKFDRIEAHIRKLFEENLPQIFTGHQPHRTLVDQLLHVMQNNMLEDGAGKSFAPDLYLLAVSPADMIEWQLHHDILDEIADSIHKTGLSEGLLFLKPP